jgi:cytoskeletal protein CcmA (bactofilin family)
MIIKAGQTAIPIANSKPRKQEQSCRLPLRSEWKHQASRAVLGKNVKVTGEIRSREPLTIEGEVEGTIDVTGHLLTIAPSGNVRASIKAKQIDVLGSLQGNVEGADKIYIRNGARVVGFGTTCSTT